MIDQAENIRRVKNHINIILERSNKQIFVIIDGDRTLIPTDSTKHFFQHLKLDYNDIKTIFRQHDYSYRAFHDVATYYSKIEATNYANACYSSANNVSIYPEFISFINSVREKAELILITSGLKQSWQNVLRNNYLDFMHVIGGNYFPSDEFIIDKEAKGIIANSIKKANKKVFAFGDTMIDFEMLKEADHSFLVVNEKHNKDFIPNAGLISHLKQVSFSEYLHPNIPLTDLNSIKRLILQ